ncbi:MAG: tetratricopeptide repeat protein [Pyrinomonadaceae bacterium]|nr:tetratricopeptide repeat protein [Pyrinomonadaceae bacterium]
MYLQRIFPVCCFVAFITFASGIAGAQQREDSNPSREFGSPSGSITGRVVLPSGRAADGNVQVNLKSSLNLLSRLPVDKNGEFRFLNLAAGVYYLETIGDSKIFEPTTQRVELARGRQTTLTIYLKLKNETAEEKKSNKTISVAELNQKVPAPAKREYERAAKLIDKGDTERAIEHLKQALTLYPNYLAAHTELGMQHLKLKQVNEAIEQFEAALKTDARSFKPRLNLGIIAVEQKHYREAVYQLQQALAVDGTQPAAHLYTGIALLGLEELQAAFDELSKALILGGSEYGVAHYYIAFIHSKRGERNEAARELKTYLETHPTGELADHARTLLEGLK